MKNKRYCCVPDMIISMSKSKEYALSVLSAIWDKRHKKNKRKVKK